MNIANNYKKWFIISILIIAVGLVFALVNGLNIGIDFTGGTMIQFDLGKTVELNEIASTIEEFDLNEEIIHAGDNNNEIIIRTKKSLSNDERVEISNKFKEKYDAEFLGAYQFSPSVGNEIKEKALVAILFASLGMLVYITFRFELIYGLAAIIALIHDVLVVLAIYAIFNIPVNSSFIAAILTIVGYSINDTIVVFDRVRENVRRMKREDNFTIANVSINQTILRSIFTSVTTLLVIGSLFVYGTPAVKEFATPLLAGVMAGTYSSIFIASPIWAILKTNKAK
ncbi:protein translocase subunit SecF [Clostridiaceae bacterium HSG29]|nr:protein translocase subunit SecF [Clostridiaceae bacterium HSG29]